MTSACAVSPPASTSSSSAPSTSRSSSPTTPPPGLRAIIAIHSTALGPALGGTRFYPYASTADALADVLDLSRGMSYKAALAGLDLGGGKAVIIGDPATLKSEALLRAYGRFVQSLGGRYYTACDVGTFSEDMDVIARECSYVTGRTVAHGGAGDSSVLTAYGVFQGMRAAAERRLGQRRRWPAGPSAWPASARSAATWCGHLVEDGATVVVTDVSAGRDRPGPRRAPRRPCGRRRPTRWSPSALDVYAPCALGGALTDEVVDVAVSARSSAAPPTTSWPTRASRRSLEERGILYAPDYCVNSGGLIQVADELEGFSLRARPAAGERHLRHHAARSSSAPRRTAYRPRSPPTGWPSAGCATSAGCAGSGCG